MIRIALLGTLCAFVALADEKQEGVEQLAEATRQLNESCGTKVSVAYDWASEAAAPGKPAYQGPLYCKSIVEGLGRTCGDAEAKAVLPQVITSINCRLELGASKKPELPSGGGAVMQLSGTTLTASYDWNSSNLDSEAYTWVIKRMPTPGPNGPMTVEARTEKKEGEARFAEAVTLLEQRCGAKIAASYDFSSEKGAAAKPAWQGFLYCKGVLEGLGGACEFDQVKLGKKLKTVQCRFEAGASKKKDLPVGGGAVHALKGDLLTASYDWNSSNLDSEARKWAAKLK